MKLITILMGCLLAPLYAVDISAPTTLLHPAPSVNAGFGSAVAISEKYYVITSPGTEVNELVTGIIYVYDTSTNQPIQKLVAPEAKAGELVGASLAISDNYLIAGLPEANQEQGKVVIWDMETGSVVHTFTHPEPQNGDRFGHAVVTHGDRLLIGVPKDEPSTTNDLTIDSGSAYLFDLPSKRFLKSFTGESNKREDSFGSSVSLTAEKVLIGCPGFDSASGEGDEGAVYIYSQTNYLLERALTIPNADTTASFGFGLAVQDDVVLVSAYRGFSTKNNCYVFDLKTGELTATITSPSTTISTFGYRIAIGEVIAIGDHFANRIGQVYLYDKKGKLLKAVTAPSAQSGDQFSSALSLHGGSLIAGAIGVDHTAENKILNAGGAYLVSVTSRMSLRILVANNEVNLKWNSTEGATYKVMMYSPDNSDEWVTLNSTPIIANAAESQYSLKLSQGGKRALFKVVAL